MRSIDSVFSQGSDSFLRLFRAEGFAKDGACFESLFTRMN